MSDGLHCKMCLSGNDEHQELAVWQNPLMFGANRSHKMLDMVCGSLSGWRCFACSPETLDGVTLWVDVTPMTWPMTSHDSWPIMWVCIYIYYTYDVYIYIHIHIYRYIWYVYIYIDLEGTCSHTLGYMNIFILPFALSFFCHLILSFFLVLSFVHVFFCHFSSFFFLHFCLPFFIDFLHGLMILLCLVIFQWFSMV